MTGVPGSGLKGPTVELRHETPSPVEVPPPRRWGPIDWWMVPAVVAAVLGGWLVAQHHGFWFDELYTAEMAPVPLTELGRAVISGEGTIPYLSDAPPSYNAAYYVVAHLWLLLTPFGANEVGLRLLSLIATVAAVAVFTRTVARLAGDDRRVAMAAGLVVATNPFVVQYAGEARGYGLALLATAIAAMGFARWLDGEHHALILFGAGAAAAGLAHWFALLVPLGLAVAGLVLRRRRGVPVLAVAGAAAVPALVLVGIALANGVSDSGAEWISGVDASAVPRLFLEAWSGRSAWLAMAALAAAAVGVAAVRRVRSDARVTAAAWLLVPVVAVAAAEAVRPVFVDRYLLPASLGLAVLVALGLSLLPGRWFAAASGLVLAMSLVATVAEVQRGPKDDVRSAVAAVAAGHRPGEPVVAAARWDALGLDHYARRNHPELMPDLYLPPAQAPDAPAIWVVRRARGGVKGDGGKLEELDRQLLSRSLRVTEERRFDGRYADVVVQRWEMSPSR